MKEDIFDLKLFHFAVKLGSISQAGSALNLNRTAASKRIATLESKFGGRLLVRSKEGISLTERGRDFYEKVEGIITQYYDLIENMTAKTNEREVVTIFTTYALCSFYLSHALSPVLKEVSFRQRCVTCNTHHLSTADFADLRI